jgi:hypothetical protein
MKAWFKFFGHFSIPRGCIWRVQCPKKVGLAKGKCLQHPFIHESMECFIEINDVEISDLLRGTDAYPSYLSRSPYVCAKPLIAVE